MAKAKDFPVREQLLDRRSRLEQALEEVSDDTQVQHLIEEVDAALERVENGIYGVCVSCQGGIESERLIADPLVRFCLDCLTPGQQRALQEDLDLATQIQTALLPEKSLQTSGWEAVYHYEGAGPVSGDYCDLLIADGDLYFIVGDVSGKGVAASMLMAHLQATFRSLVSLGLPLDQVMTRASRMFCESTLPTHFATLVCGKANGRGEVQICNAGHNSPLLVQGSKMVGIEATGLPLGMFCEERFSVNQVRMNPGDTILLYTDGLSEAVNGSGREYGTKRLCEIVKQHCSLGPKEVISACLKDLNAFRSGTPRTDDLTIMVIRRLDHGD
jgi:sigma-B regulation protein RsbU (phosphoserine phosphatase)